LFVYANGDADISHLFSLIPMLGKEGTGYHQETTLPFRIGGVTESEYIAYANKHKTLANVVLRIDGPIDCIRILKPLISTAKKAGRLYLPNSDTILLFNTSRKGELACNATHAPIINFQDGKEIAEILEDLRKRAVSVFHFMKIIYSGLRILI